MTSGLHRLAKLNKDLRAELPDAREFAGLVNSGATRLADARNATVSLEGRFDVAYGAAHALCRAALRYKGFRTEKRFLVFQVLPDTLGLGPEVWRVLSKAHEIRNLGEYEGNINVTERLVADLIAACDVVLEKIKALPPLA